MNRTAKVCFISMNLLGLLLFSGCQMKMSIPNPKWSFKSKPTTASLNTSITAENVKSIVVEGKLDELAALLDTSAGDLSSLLPEAAAELIDQESFEKVVGTPAFKEAIALAHSSPMEKWPYTVASFRGQWLKAMSELSGKDYPSPY